MSIGPLSAAIIEVAKQSIKEIGKGISEGLKEGLKEGADKLSDGIKEKYLQKDTPSISETTETIPLELQDNATEVVEVEQVIESSPEIVKANPEEIKATIESIETKINTFIEGYRKNIDDKASLGVRADHIVDNGIDILKDVISYANNLKGRLNEAGLNVDKITEHFHSIPNYSDIEDTDYEDLEESE